MLHYLTDSFSYYCYYNNYYYMYSLSSGSSVNSLAPTLTFGLAVLSSSSARPCERDKGRYRYRGRDRDGDEVSKKIKQG